MPRTPALALALAASMIAFPSSARAQGPPDPAEARRAEVLSAKLAFSPFVFGGPSFPPCDVEDPARLRELIGPYRIEATYFDDGGRRVDVAGTAGPYRVVARIIPESGGPSRRMATIYRIPDGLDPGRRPDESEADLVRLVGGVPAVLYPAMVRDRARGRTLAEASRDPAFARLLAGLAAYRVGDPTLRGEADAVDLDRQRWVELIRRLEGSDREHPRPAVGPRPIEGPPATVLHVGTLAEAGFRPGSVEAIDAICRSWAADSDQAFAVCVARRGVVVLHQAYGTRDGRPMTVDTPSRMASVTKAMSATLMMTLVDQGLVDLDAPAEVYLPALRGAGGDRRLTVRHLYTHTSGLDRWPGWADELPDVEDRVAGAMKLLKVGDRWAYNGLGYTLGGKIIENVTGEAVPIAFRNHFLAPLGCTGTEVHGTHGDARSIPMDMARFGQMLLNGGSYGSRSYFSAETFNRMLPARLTRELGPDTTKVFGIGLDGSTDRFGHGAASSATFHVDRANELVVIVTRNLGGTNWEKYQGRLWDAIKAGLDPPFRESR